MQFLTSQKIRQFIFQATFLIVIFGVILAAYFVGQKNIIDQGIATGFDFLTTTTGWPISFTLIDYSPRSTYTTALFIGLLNTLLVGLLTIFFATLLGLVLALMRVSGNKMMMLIGTAYVEIFRNIPVILQVFFWYSILTHLPGVRDAYSIFDIIYLSNRGFMFPIPAFSAGDIGLLILALGIAVIGYFLLRQSNLKAWRLPLFGSAFLMLASFLLISGHPPETPLFSIPEARGLRFVGGLALKPEFTALLIGLTLFGTSYIGEIIRGGLLSVDRGRLEAGAALGLTPFQINRLIRIPLAFRAMLPALANQFVWLMKATTVGIAIGFPDYFAIISTSINQSGQTLELLAFLMLGFIVINYSISFLMNVLNARLRLKGKS